MSELPATFAEALSLAQHVHDRGFTFLDAERRPSRKSYAELSGLAAALGQSLNEQGVRAGQRIALIAPEPQDFVRGLFALWHVGAVPVPMCPPGFAIREDAYSRSCAPLLQAARPHGLLAPRSVLELLGPVIEQRASDALRLALDAPVPTSTLSTSAVVEAAPDDVALVQLTSGSTSNPRGVVVSHSNLVANALRLQRDVAETDDRRDVGVSWLPLYHDMGLIGFVISPLLRHSNIVLMSPATFASYPRGWLEVISEYRGTVTSAPNFAYEVAMRHCTRPERLDLSCLRVLACGAEPISAPTIARFLDKFRVAGLRPEAFAPAYGLAEATLAVATGRGLRTLRVARTPLHEQGLVVRDEEAPEDASLTLVSCGQPIADHTVSIVNEQGELLGEEHVGEICVSGPSVAQGYLDEQGRVGPFGPRLTTGDLGFLRGGELYIVGRKKDLIIVGGRNYAPQPIEASVEAISTRLFGRAAAFATPGERTEQLVVIIETHRYEEELVQEARRRVREDHGLNPREVVLVPRGSLPRTSSGKLQRARLRALYLADELPRLVADT